MKIAFDGFDWDKGNRSKIIQHGLSPIEIEQLFVKNELELYPDLKHSDGEARYIAIGRTSNLRYAFIAFTFRHKAQRVLIRPISARYMRPKEVKRYEKEKNS